MNLRGTTEPHSMRVSGEKCQNTNGEGPHCGEDATGRASVYFIRKGGV